MKEDFKKKLWPLWIILGAIPGSVIWLFLVSADYAGEFAGIVLGFGAIAFYRWSEAELKYARLFIGAAMLIVVALLTNHLAYSLDIFNKFAENWYGAAGKEFSFSEASKIVFDDFFLNNVEGMRKFYVEAAVQGILCSLLFWIALFVYYRKLDELEGK